MKKIIYAILIAFSFCLINTDSAYARKVLDTTINGPDGSTVNVKKIIRGNKTIVKVNGTASNGDKIRSRYVGRHNQEWRRTIREDNKDL